jgi:Uma2 family endonuclease
MTDASDILLKPITVAMIEALEAEQGRFYELVDGELQEKEMATPLHGKIASRLNIFIGGFVLKGGIGQTYDSSASYVLRGTSEKPELIYLPDFSFVAQERVQDKDRGFFLGAPDLAVEVISPSERPAAIARKLRNYLAHGVKQVWHVYPDKRQVIIHMPDGSSQTYEGDSVISNIDFLPGFELSLSDIFGN